MIGKGGEGADPGLWCPNREVGAGGLRSEARKLSEDAT